MTYALGQGTGPLAGVKVVELAGIGPGPHACMILADLGADVVRVDRPGGGPLGGGPHDILTRGRPSVALDLKRPEAVETVLRLVEGADVLVEGMRPGAAERLGLGPDVCHARNERLVFAPDDRVGPDRPAGALRGPRHELHLGRRCAVRPRPGPARPHFPSNLLGDFGGGSTYLVIGVLAALLEARVSGRGQVVDAAIVDGTAHLNAIGAVFHATGIPGEQRVSGPARRRHALLRRLRDRRRPAPLGGTTRGPVLRGVPGPARARRRGAGPQRLRPLGDLRTAIAARIKERTQSEWVAELEGTDACVAGIIPLAEAFEHPHNKAREVYVDRDGLVQPAPAPRFSRTAASLTTGPSPRGLDPRSPCSVGIDDVDALIDQGVAVQA